MSSWQQMYASLSCKVKGGIGFIAWGGVTAAEYFLLNSLINNDPSKDNHTEVIIGTATASFVPIFMYIIYKCTNFSDINSPDLTPNQADRNQTDIKQIESIDLKVSVAPSPRLPGESLSAVLALPTTLSGHIEERQRSDLTIQPSSSVPGPDEQITPEEGSRSLFPPADSKPSEPTAAPLTFFSLLKEINATQDVKQTELTPQLS